MEDLPPGAASGRAAEPAADRQAEPVADRTVVIERTFDVPARILFLAHSRPEHVARWFGPPGCPLARCEIDFRVGGRYRFAMTGADGVQLRWFGGEYRAIVPDERITYSNTFEQPGAETMIVTVTFIERGGRTVLRMATVFGSFAMKAQHLGMGFQRGAGASFELLAEVVRDLRAGAGDA